MDDQKRHGHENNSTGERDDFIVITEFSEREGPISPLTIPIELPAKWNFNKSKFALRVLGSEFRKKKALGTLPSINVCDMQQFFEDDTNELYIYCHYCSIADFGARGYTRALCLTYITPTPKKIQRIFSWLKRVFTQTAMILKKAAQKTFLKEIDEIIKTIDEKKVNSNNNDIEYNDLFQCHLNEENRQNILIDMKEIRQLFGVKLLDKQAAMFCDDSHSHSHSHAPLVILNRMRHRPHRVGKEGYKPLKQIVGKDDYNKFRDSLRNIHSQFHKNCLDIYVDIKNKELSHLNPNRLFAIGSLSCLDIEPCHYLSPSNNCNQSNESIVNNNNNNQSNQSNESMKYLASIINITTPVVDTPVVDTPAAAATTAAVSHTKHPNLFLNKNDENKTNITENNSKKKKPKIRPSQHLSGRNYKNKKFLKLYDRKLQRIERKNSQIMGIRNDENKQRHVQQLQQQQQQHDDNKQQNSNAEEGVTKMNIMKKKQDIVMNNIWENFIMTRNKCDLEVHKERKNKHKSHVNVNVNSNVNSNVNVNINVNVKEGLITCAKPSKTNVMEARFRECSDRAREKNLSRCLLGRFRGFAESILFTILTNRTLVILANDPLRNKEKVEKTVRALSLLIPGVENTNSTQEWRQQVLYCHELPKLKIVGMSSELCHKSPDNIWDLITIIQFDDSILYGPPYKYNDENKSFIHKMLHPRKRFKTPNLFYRYLSRIMLEMSLHVFLFYYISQKTIINLSQNDVEPNNYYKALLETLQFTQSSDIDIAKHWCHIMQNQLYSLCKPIIVNAKNNKDIRHNRVRKELLTKYGQRPPPIVRIT